MLRTSIRKVIKLPLKSSFKTITTTKMPQYYASDFLSFTNSPYPVINLISDTFSKPTPAMRKAMFEAEVGDDIYGEDPTANRLEKRVAELFKKEASIFLSTGTMGNLVAVLAHCDRRGCEILIGDQSHIFLYEQGGPAQLGNIHSRTLPNLDDGTFDLELLERSIRGHDIHSPITALVCIENTHNMSGGKVLPMEWIDKLSELCKKYGLPLHMDGARIFNAAVHLNLPVWKIAEKADSVQFCFSKGLGAPVGSMLVGTKELIHKARRLRKLVGSAMRQVGVIAAPCEVALDTMVDRLKEDHQRTRRIAQAIDDLNCDFIRVDINNLQTNILMIDFPTKTMNSADFCTRMAKVTDEESKQLKDKAVLVRASPKSGTIVRLVLYYEITDELVDKVITKIKYIAEEVKKNNSF